jgi:hypothetical protein
MRDVENPPTKKTHRPIGIVPHILELGESHFWAGLMSHRYISSHMGHVGLRMAQKLDSGRISGSRMLLSGNNILLYTTQYVMKDILPQMCWILIH